MSTAAPKKRKEGPGAHTSHKDKKAKSKAVKTDERPITINFNSGNGLLIARTPGVEPPSDLTFAAFAKEGRKRRKLHLHSASHPRLDFTAPSVSRQAPHGRDRHMLGIFDPETNELQVIPAEVVTMKSTLKKAFSQRRRNSVSEEEDEAEEARSFYQRRADLGEAFGTKKAKKALKSAAANSVGGSAKSNVPLPVTAMTEAIVENARDAIDAEVHSKEDLTKLVHATHPRPKPNAKATVPGDIYALDEVIPWKELSIVDDQGWKNAISGGASIKTTSRFIAHRVVRVYEQKDKVKNKAMKYLCALIYFYNALVPKGKDGSKGLPSRDKMDEAMIRIDETTKDNIKRRFTPKHATRLSPWDVNRVLLYACAMAIVLDDCITEVKDLQEDLKLDSRQIKNLYQELGCTVEAFKDDKSQQVAKLKLPFALPEVRQRRMIRR